MNTCSNLNQVLVFSAGMFVGGSIILAICLWNLRITKPTARAVDPKSPLFDHYHGAEDRQEGCDLMPKARSMGEAGKLIEKNASQIWNRSTVVTGDEK